MESPLISVMQSCRQRLARGSKISAPAFRGGDMATRITKDVVDLGAALATERLGNAVSEGKINPKAEVAGEEFKTRPALGGANKEPGQEAIQNIGKSVSKEAGQIEQAGAAPKSIRDAFEEPRGAVRTQ